MSNQRLAGLCGPRHTWEESEQEKSRSIYSEAASESGPCRSSFYHDGVGGAGVLDYAGDELAWEWREATRLRVQDAFEFCLTSGRASSGTAGAADLRWSSVSSSAFGYRNRRHLDRHRRRRTAKGKEPSNEKSEFDVATTDEGFDGIEKVLAAVGFPNTGSPSRRGVLSEDLFAAPASFGISTEREPQKQEFPTIEPLRYQEPGPSTGKFTGLEPLKMAKRNSKDKVPGSSTAVVGGAPLLNLPYPFSKPGSGQVSSNDLVLFPVGGVAKPDSKKSQNSAKGSKSGTSTSNSTSGGSESVTGSGSAEDNAEEEDDEDEDEEGDEFDSEEPSEPASGSMSSLGHPISPTRYPFGTRRPGGAGHARTPSGVSSGLSSGAGLSGGSHAHSHSMSSGTKSVMGVSVLSQSTGNKNSTDSESGVVEGRSLSHGSSPLGGGGVIPMPPRHPHPQGQGRGRSGTAPSSTVASAAATLAGIRALHTTPIAFPTVHQQRRRADSGRIMINPALHYGSDIEGQHELNDDDLDEIPDDDNNDDDPIGDNDYQDEQAEQDDRVGLLGVPPSPLASRSRISLSATSSSSGSVEARSRTHSSFSMSSRSRRSSPRARSRTRTHSSQGTSVRERASSLGASMRSLMRNTTASMSQLDLIMRGATGPAAGLGVGNSGSRPRSRVNSSMAKVEEDEVLLTTSTVPATAAAVTEERRVSGGSSGNGSHNGSLEVSGSSLMVRRSRQEFEEGYSSSGGGTHSRSGSEMSGENYTFGRPVLFMRPVQEQQDQPVEGDDEDEIVLVERSNRGSPDRSAVPMLSMTTEGGGPGSVLSECEPSTTSEATASPGRGGDTPMLVPVQRSLSESPPSHSNDDHSPERQGLGIPWNHPQQQQVPPLERRQQDVATTTTTTSGSSDGSCPTSAPTTVVTSGRRSWEGVVSEIGVMAERPREDMGVGAVEQRGV